MHYPVLVTHVCSGACEIFVESLYSSSIISQLSLREAGIRMTQICVLSPGPHSECSPPTLWPGFQSGPGAKYFRVEFTVESILVLSPDVRA